MGKGGEINISDKFINYMIASQSRHYIKVLQPVAGA